MTSRQIVPIFLAVALSGLLVPWAYYHRPPFGPFSQSSTNDEEDGEDNGEDDGEEDNTPSHARSTGEGSMKHYVRREQIWDDEMDEWVPFDPSSVKHPPAPTQADPQGYFYLNLRREAPLNKPKTVLSSFSDHLKQLLRGVIGDEFFDTSPEYVLEDFFPHLKELGKRMDVIRAQLLKKGTLEEILP
ncbi:hypothetical protein GLOTRDRAFT_139331 [Gloeophyllum trabeum ATCC 11539]|uniref:Uncharacterized protein n=1 Tax=Gloeophyllum trabeum (strain ATCC 11539 / FP-39264 / Madison 617) TaxID=670483 RepID=S7Q5W1_GLOTA|nr:uncharacterized protein GLOTRDRAFT_139331 [Gloeophyllum trabeum ATCC 11539]EPQ54862.1 hypothetical protein GLOTRDRAFT_139331 [Gloeophyllum trabeum ATCC 11539]